MVKEQGCERKGCGAGVIDCPGVARVEGIGSLVVDCAGCSPGDGSAGDVEQMGWVDGRTVLLEDDELGWNPSGWKLPAVSGVLSQRWRL